MLSDGTDSDKVSMAGGVSSPMSAACGQRQVLTVGLHQILVYALHDEYLALRDFGTELPLLERLSAALANEKPGLEAGGTSKGGAPDAAQAAHLGGGTFKDGLRKPKRDSGEIDGTACYCWHEVPGIGGKSAYRAYGGPLCIDPSRRDISIFCQEFFREAQQDEIMRSTNFTDLRPQLNKQLVEQCKAFDCGYKTLRLSCSLVPWPAGCLFFGYVPQSDWLNGRRITISGRQKEFIELAIDTGKLVGVEVRRITPDTDKERTGGLHPRIGQFGGVCSLDPLVAAYIYLQGESGGLAIISTSFSRLAVPCLASGRSLWSTGRSFLRDGCWQALL